MSYFSCVEEIHNSDMATASALDSERPALNPDSNLSASSTPSLGDDITKMQASDTSVQHVAECVSVPVVEDIPAGNDTTDNESFGSIQVAGTGANIVEDHFVGSKQMGAGDFMQCDQQLLSPNDIDVRDQSSVSDKVRGQSSVSDNVKVSQSVQPELEQTAKKCRHRRRSRIRRILRWFTKCIRANDSDVEH
ncbi:uncharacterized protein [Ptychodera flava]|uniref:uncharacterized protein n=1 Tax=Ptychodera flava TaxID=63121 RepID=UPI003969C70D